MEPYRRALFLGMILTALGIVLTTTMGEATGALGVVFIAVGGLFFIIGMQQKKKADEAGGDPGDQ